MSFPGAAAADVLWDGAASKGRKVMKLPNAEDGADMQQNFPVVIKALNGRLTLEHHAPGKVRTAVVYPR